MPFGIIGDVFIEDCKKFRCADLRPKEKDIKYIDVRNEAFKIFGLYNMQSKNYYRLPKEIAESLSEGIAARMRESAGIRVRFATDSPFVAVKAKTENFTPFPHVTNLAAKGFDLYIEERGNYTFNNSFYPPVDLENEIVGITYFDTQKNRNIIIDFPFGAAVTDFKIGIKKDSSLTAGHPYSDNLPIVFFGSSATQGFAASRPGNTYENFISRALNVDYINMGFAGCALGENILAEYFSKIPMSAFVMDYDYYAPDIEYLEKTYLIFYNKIRQKNPNLPIVLISKPERVNTKDGQRRKKVVIDTYCNAVLAGDNNIYYIDGDSLFAKKTGFDCMVDDNCPNDLGMYFISQRIIKVLSKII